MTSQPDSSDFLQLGEAYQREFDTFSPASMPPDKRAAYTEWLAEHPEYTPRFGQRLQGALDWARSNPEIFAGMLQDMDTAIAYLNDNQDPIDGNVYSNITEYRRVRDASPLPLLLTNTAPSVEIARLPEDSEARSQPNWTAFMAVRGAARRLRLGETIRPEDGDFYAYHNFIQSDKGMAAASLADLYESFTRTTGQYPIETDNGALIAGALTEALEITRPDGELFKALRDPADEWAYAYPGFSPEFQYLLYGGSQDSQWHSQPADAA